MNIGAFLLAQLVIVALAVMSWGLLPRWHDRGIHLTTFDVGATATAALGVALVASAYLPTPAVVAAAAFTVAGLLAAVSDARWRLIPSGAMWASTAVGLVELLAAVREGDRAALWTVGALAVVTAVFTLVAVVTGGFGGGDLRLLVMATTTLWWMPGFLLLAATLGALVSGAVHAIATRRAIPAGVHLVVWWLASGVAAVALSG